MAVITGVMEDVDDIWRWRSLGITTKYIPPVCWQSYRKVLKRGCIINGCEPNFKFSTCNVSSGSFLIRWNDFVPNTSLQDTIRAIVWACSDMSLGSTAESWDPASCHRLQFYPWAALP